MVPSSWSEKLRWKIRGKTMCVLGHWRLSCLRDTPKWLVQQAVRYRSLKLRGNVRAGNRDMSMSFCPLGLCKSNLISFSHGGPLNTWGQPWHSSTPPRWAAWRPATLGSFQHHSLWRQSSWVVGILATQSVAYGPAASPRSCEKCKISNSPTSTESESAF